MTSGFRSHAVAGLAVVVALFLIGSGVAQARPGFYLGLGGAQTSVSGGLDGSHSYADPSGNPQFLDGKFKDGSGVAAEAGYGVNTHFGVEYLFEDTTHRATSSFTPAASNAEFTSQMFGIRLTAPFSQRFEAFLRGGYGVYEADYSSFAKDATTNQTSKVAYFGTGTAIGAGFELFFQEVGIELGYTQHSYSMDRAKPTGGQLLNLPSTLNGTASTLDVMVAIHF